MASVPAPQPVVLRLRPDASAPGRARRGLEHLGLPRRVLDDAAIVLSELVTNCVVHGGGGDIEVRLEVGPTLRLEVGDGGPGFTPGPLDMPLDGLQGGRGLPLVEALTARWGVDARGGFRVWAELAL
ncbi:ATP-binding protein [Miltoncostaea marina]|uniref:ATP-binding protein n=1 Tax=Miltoncostaea marina TaxID=2843215 RepID=UPI001C3D3D9A|nr:ATP-binding protein [Miltoncostaea marina]